jgi:Family of unknown function (DUF6325)
MTEVPVEFLLVELNNSRLPSEVVHHLIDLVDIDAIRILDLLLITKQADGTVTTLEIDELDDSLRELFFELDGEYDGLFSDGDAAVAADSISTGATALALLWESGLSRRFGQAVEECGGRLIINERVPRSVVEGALADFA